MNFIDIEKLRQVLPVQPGILGKEDYFNSAVLIPLIKIDDEFHFLFEKRAEHIRQGGEICFPGGEIDPQLDRNATETALRETEEEIGILRRQIDLIGTMDTLIGPRGITVDSCIGIVNIASIDECKTDPEEVASVFTVPFSFFIENEPEVFHAESDLNYTFYNPNGDVEELIPSRKKSMNDHIDQSYTKTRRKVLVYRTNGEVIWGITARLIYEVVEKLKD